MLEIDKTIRKIGSELDSDILEWMLGIDKDNPEQYPRYYYLNHPVDNMLEWQAMRDRKPKKNDICEMCGQNHNAFPYTHV